MKTKINLRKTRRSESHWASQNDDHPETTTREVWSLEVAQQVDFNWGPLKSRPSSKKTHTGIVQVEVRQSEFFYSAEEANTAADKIKADLKNKNSSFVESSEDQIFKQDWWGHPEQKTLLLTDVPRFLKKQIEEAISVKRRAGLL